MNGPQTTGQKEVKTQSTCMYFYVVIPPEDQAKSNDSSKIVTTSAELTAIMKRNPRARFMAASTAEEAMKKAFEKIQFSKDTESIASNTSTPPKRKGRQSFSAVEASIGAPAIESPKTAELLFMGREISGKKTDLVFERITKNPRILCTDSEFPTILQEGCKYNAAHLAAKSNNFEVLKFILNQVSSIDFMRRIYPNQDEERLIASCKHLVKGYLNSPDKMLYETPLHFACKFNAEECVDILLRHPFCDTKLLNFDKLTAYEIIGSRDDIKGGKASRIRKLFEKRYIVPIWRDIAVEGDPPTLGEECFMHDLGQAIPDPLLRTYFPDFSIQLLDRCKASIAPKTSNSKVFVSQPVSWKIRAFAGPMEKEKAKEFRNVMKQSKFFLFQVPLSTPNSSFDMADCIGNEGMTTPPGTPRKMPPDTPPPSGHLLLSPIRSARNRPSFCESPVWHSPLKTDMAARVRDVDKGLERIASEYCAEMDIPWSEYWKFLGVFCDIRTDHGLELLETHLKSLEAKNLPIIEHESSSDESRPSAINSTMEEVIYRFQNVKLSDSGMTTPDHSYEAYCLNPNCQMESRFCNCEEVAPSFLGNNKDHSNPIFFTDGDDFIGENPFPSTNTNNLDVALGIRKLDLTSNTDSFNVSDHPADDDFVWPAPDPAEYFQTAPSSPVECEENDIFEECNSVKLFLSGKEPGKLDFQVYQYLRDLETDVDPGKHLLTFQWLNAMRAYGRKTFTTTCTCTELTSDGRLRIWSLDRMISSSPSTKFKCKYVSVRISREKCMIYVRDGCRSKHD